MSKRNDPIAHTDIWRLWRDGVPRVCLCGRMLCLNPYERIFGAEALRRTLRERGREERERHGNTHTTAAHELCMSVFRSVLQARPEEVAYR